MIPVDPFALAAKLGVDITNANGQVPPVAVDTNEREAVDLDAHSDVRAELALDTGDRSVDTYRIVCAVLDAGLNLAQARWVIDQRADLAARVVEFLARGRDDVNECWQRAAREWPRNAGGLGVTRPQAVNPAAFFSKTGGLLVRTLADAVMTAVGCGHGFGRFYTYLAGVWLPDADRIEAEVVSLLGNRYRHAYLTNVCDVIKHSPAVTRITGEPMAEFINVINGMVLWRTGRLLSHDRVYRSTVQLPVEYVPGADCPHFEQFLTEVLPPDLVEPTTDSPGFIWELIGYTFYSGNPMHVAVLLHGAGRNGKGTLIRVLKALLGARNCSSVGLHQLVDSKFSVAQLLGKLANLAGDLDAKWIENTAVFKAITGEDTIQAEEKYNKPFDFTPWALPFYSTNKPFGSADSSEGWMARWVVVPFPNSFLGKEDRKLTERLTSESELRGILARGIAALPALMNRGRFAELQSLVDAKAEFMVASDSMRAWVDEECVLGIDEWTPRSELYRAYQILHFGDRQMLGNREFYNRLGQMGGIRPNLRQGTRGFSGIRLKTTSEKPSANGFWGAG